MPLTMTVPTFGDLLDACGAEAACRSAANSLAGYLSSGRAPLHLGLLFGAAACGSQVWQISKLRREQKVAEERTLIAPPLARETRGGSKSIHYVDETPCLKVDGSLLRLNVSEVVQSPRGGLTVHYKPAGIIRPPVGGSESLLASVPAHLTPAERPRWVGLVVGNHAGVQKILGGGFRLGEHFITAAHVLLEETAIQAGDTLALQGDGDRALRLDIHAAENKRAYELYADGGTWVPATASDMVAIKLTSSEWSTLGIQQFNPANVGAPSAGTITVCGPSGNRLCASRGYIDATLSKKGQCVGVLMHTATTEHGFSGFPLHMARASGSRIVGLHLGGTSYGHDRNVAASGAALRAFMKKLGYMASLTESREPDADLDPPDAKSVDSFEEAFDIFWAATRANQELDDDMDTRRTSRQVGGGNVDAGYVDDERRDELEYARRRRRAERFPDGTRAGEAAKPTPRPVVALEPARGVGTPAPASPAASPVALGPTEHQLALEKKARHEVARQCQHGLIDLRNVKARLFVRANGDDTPEQLALEKHGHNPCPVANTDLVDSDPDAFTGTATAQWAQAINEDQRRYRDGWVEPNDNHVGYNAAVMLSSLNEPRDGHEERTALFNEASTNINDLVTLANTLHDAGFTVQELLQEPYMKDLVDYVAHAGFQYLPHDGDAAAAFADGTPALRRIARGRRGARKPYKAGHSLNKEQVTALEAAGVSVSEGAWVMPPTGDNAVYESLVAQLERITPSRLNNIDVAAAVGFTGSHPVHSEPVFYYPDEGGVPFMEYMDKVMDAFQTDKSAGFTAEAIPNQGNVKAGFLNTTAKRNKMFRLVKARLLLRIVVGPTTMGTMTPAELVALGLKDPHVATIKPEPHSAAKALGRRWRTIWVQSLLDALVASVTHRNSSKVEIAKYQASEHHVAGSGMGHADLGVARTGEVLQWLAPDKDNGYITSVDAQAWDLSVCRDSIMYDAARRIDTLSLGELYYENAVLYETLCVCEAHANSAHVLVIGDLVMEVCKYGLTASGVITTSSQNSCMRGMHAHNITRRRVHANGDDLLVAGKVTAEEAAQFQAWGINHKAYAECSFGDGDAVPYTSHLYRRDHPEVAFAGLLQGAHKHVGQYNFVISAEYDNFEKMCAKIVLNYDKKKCPPDALLGGVKFAVRHSGDKLKQLDDLCDYYGWNKDAMPVELADAYA